MRASDENSRLEWYIGLMSGTSLDGIDGVLVNFSHHKITVAHHVSAPFAHELRAELLALNTPGFDELHRSALAGNALAHAYAGIVETLLERSHLNARDISAIGAHGQTVRHRPQEFDSTGYTLQLNNPALLAERTGIRVVADFRTRDVAAAGQGAPLVPAFHHHVFGKADETVLVLNIGGMSNLSVLAADGSVSGFDCGPGNALMDFWCHQHTGHAYDAAGAWAAAGRVLPDLLASFLREPFLHQPPPKSTGRDLFNPAWLAAQLNGISAAPVDIQATLAELTASVCATAAIGSAKQAKTLAVCGGGAFNSHVMRRLQDLLPDTQVVTTDTLGLPAMQVEAAAFAWLARQTLLGKPGNLPSATGARGARVLGAIYPR